MLAAGPFAGADPDAAVGALPRLPSPLEAAGAVVDVA